MNDNVRRSLRTALQALLGVAASGGLTKVWESYTGNHTVDVTVQLAVGVLVLTPVASWAQNELEDLVGKGIMVPHDKTVGQEVLAAESV